MVSEAQREAGNYRMQHIRMHGLAISIETPKGKRRRPEWPPMAADYGYIKGTRGRDGDHLDVFVGPNRSSELVYVVDQSGASGKRFDEHKIMLGYESQAEAVAAYRACYTPGWTVGPVTAMTIGQFKNWIKGGDHMKPLAKQVSRYAYEFDSLYLAPELFTDLYHVDRYEWNSSEHPRHEAGAPNSMGGQFAPTGQAATGNRPGGSLSPRMLASAQEKAWISSDPSKHLQPVEPYKPAAPLTPEMAESLRESMFAKPQPSMALKPTRKREIAALPDTIKEGHALHLSALSTRDRADLLDWSRRLNEAMAKVQGPNEEAEWRNVNKGYVRAMLDEMNKRDSAARGRGVRLSDYINANGLIPEALAARLDGGKRFFDPEHIRDRIKAGNPTPEQVAAEQQRKAHVDAFKFGSRKDRKAIMSTPGELREAVYRAMGLTPGAGLRQTTPAPSFGDTLAAIGAKRGKTPERPAKTPELDSKTPELSSKPPEPEAKPPEQDSLHTAIKSAFDQFSKRDQKKIDEAIRGGDESMSSDIVSSLRQDVLDTWRQMTEETQDHNRALREIMGQFSKNWGLVSAALAQGRDVDKIRGYDQMADFARTHYPQMLARGRSESETGSDEESLAKALMEGIKKVPNPWDQEVIAKANERVGAAIESAASGDYPEFPSDPDDPDYVPFSVKSIVAEVMRYWNAPDAVEKICA